MTRTVYKVPGQGLTFCADPRDVRGAGAIRGFADWPHYEEVA